MGAGTGDVSGLVRGPDGLQRCYWVGQHADYVRYHDREWGVPVSDDRLLFEKICLEGFQSGLSWLTILRKRRNFRQAFENFDLGRVAAFDQRDVQRLLRDRGIVRHRGKIEAVINNARKAASVVASHGSLAAFLWQWEPVPRNRPPTIDRHVLETLTKTRESTAMARELKKLGWRFVGPTTAYAFMQSMGMVNDHVAGCCRRKRVQELRSVFSRPGPPARP